MGIPARALMLSALAACATPKPPAAPKPAQPDHTAPSWFRGAWKLEAIRPSTVPMRFIVRDLQTPTMFGSVRVSKERPSFAGVTSFDDLNDEQLAALVDQRGGFAGAATFDNNVALWNHEIEFQPLPPDMKDTATLEPLTPVTVLEKIDADFSEVWWQMSSGDGRFLGIRVSSGKRTERILVVVGDHFVYARNRKTDLRPTMGMKKLVEEMKPSRAQLVEILDCEVSYGTVRSGRMPWEIRYSTLPWREGTALQFASEITIDASGAPVSTTQTAGWAVPVNTFAADDLRALFPGR